MEVSIKPSRNPDIPHPGKVFYHGQWRSPEAVEAIRAGKIPCKNPDLPQPGMVFFRGWWRTPEGVKSTLAKEKARVQVGRKIGYRKFMGDVCERCGFVPQVRAQLDVHHKDRDRSNNSPENLETICANCHRLEHAVAQRAALTVA